MPLLPQPWDDPVEYPTDLPRPLIEAHSFADEKIAKETKFEVGEPRLRRLYRSAPQTARARWRFTQVEFDEFYDWFEDTLLSGAKPFTVDLATQGSNVPGFVEYLSRFVEPYEAAALAGRRWDVTAMLLVGLQLPVGEGSEAASIGFADPITGDLYGYSYYYGYSYSYASYAHANAGSQSFENSVFYIYCGVVGYDAEASPVVVWDFDWTPNGSGVYVPTVTPIGPGGSLLRIAYRQPGFPFEAGGGSAVITATVGGVPTDAIQYTCAGGFYGSLLTWGPVP